jgi:hypothetical protein
MYPDPPQLTPEMLRSFIEKEPLYKKLRAQLPTYAIEMGLDVVFLQCSVCQIERPFRDVKQGVAFPATGSPPRLATGFRHYYFRCTGCQQKENRFWVEINVEQGWLWKVGQAPIWLPPIPKDIEKELGEDAELYKRALRCMNESYGIGACAYLRRLLENQINPLLKLLYEIKAEEGANKEDLQKITDVMKSKDFTSKTEFASQFAPKFILVEGFNPFKLIHDNLSVGLHQLDEETCMIYATEISETLVYIIRGLKKHQQEKREYIERLKMIRRLKT